MSKNVGRLLLSVCVLVSLAGILPQGAQAQEVRPVVVLSPGHGWWSDLAQQIDPGATSDDLVEKDINLDVARYAQGYLQRCPVDVYLTREGDDPTHTLFDVDEIVNGYHPTVGVSIHTNSGDGSPSGSEGWYTVNGYDDAKSMALAGALSKAIASRLQIEDRGIQPETNQPEGGLYIHWWQAPSALVEIAFIQGDAELLRTEKDEFGRSIAQAILEYLAIDLHCADRADPYGIEISTYLPGEAKVSEITLQNNSLLGWSASEYTLMNIGKPFGADMQYPLAQDTGVNDTAEWVIPAVAPNSPGIFRQEWQLARGTLPFEEKVTVYLIVVPEQARELKEEIDRKIEELRQLGEEELEQFVAQLEKEAIDWVKEELPQVICGQQAMLVGFAVGAVLVFRRRTRLP